MSLLALILAFGLSVAWCAERLVRSTHPAACLLALPSLIGSWVALMTLRIPPPAEFALVAFGLADIAVLVLSTLGVLRLLGAFEGIPGDDGDDDDRQPPLPDPTPIAPRGRRPHRPARRQPPRPRRRPGAGPRVNA